MRMESRNLGWCHRVGALALATLVWLAGCATVPAGGRTAEDESLITSLPMDFEPVRLGDAEFKSALAGLLLEIPLPVATSRSSLYASRKRMLASAQPTCGVWQSELEQSYARFCERCGTPGDCLTLFEDGPSLRADDKRSIALALAVGPALEGVDAEVRAMFSPARLLATVSITLTAYMALLVAPEPVSKGVVAAFSVLMWGYLGWEFFDLLRAYVQLSQEAERATTFAELREAGERFGRVIGPNSVRILVLVGTAAVGETAALASRAPRLPGFGQASRTVEMHGGLRLMEAATGAETVILSVPEGSIRVVLASNVVAMATSQTIRVIKGGTLLSNGHRAWRSHSGFAKAMGKAGKNKQWHHIVEQTPGNVKRFGPEALHNTENVVPVEDGLHKDLSRLYSSIRVDITSSRRLTVRQWLSTQSYEAQRRFGLLAIENISKGIWP